MSRCANVFLFLAPSKSRDAAAPIRIFAVQNQLSRPCSGRQAEPEKCGVGIVGARLSPALEVCVYGKDVSLVAKSARVETRQTRLWGGGVCACIALERGVTWQKGM